MPRPRRNPILDADGEDRSSQGLPADLIGQVDPALPKTAQVYDLIRRAIVAVALRPGSTINEKRICGQLGLSRTPVREAILQLSAEGLVTIIPNSRTYVSKIDLQSVFDGQLVRDALEVKVVRLAAVRMNSAFERQLDFNMEKQSRLADERSFDAFYGLDEAFHSMICVFGASERIWRIVNAAKAQLDRVRRLAFPAPNHLQIILDEHAAVVEGLKLRDPDQAAAAMKIHVDRVFLTIRNLLVDQSQFFESELAQELDRYEMQRTSERAR